jgi:hypothetical protein
VREARLAAPGWAGRNLSEHVGLGRPEAVQAALEVTHARELPERAPAPNVLEDGERIETSRVVNEAVARIRDGHDPREKAVSALEPRGVLVEGADEPLSDRAQPNDDDSHFV